MMRWGAIAGMALLAACSGQAEDVAAPDANASAVADNGAVELAAAPESAATPENATAPAEAPAATPAGQANSWLVGVWTYDENCDGGIGIHYKPDGSLDDESSIGTWSIAGDTVTQTITGEYELGEEPTPVNPPRIYTFRVERVDATHAIVHHEGDRIPILKCR